MKGRRSAAGSLSWLVGAGLMLVFAVLPVGLVLSISGPDERAYVCEIETRSSLASTMGGKLQFLMVRALEGRAPASDFVITTDGDYTRGAEQVSPGDVLWVEGTLMDRETFFGEQYLFFGHPQIYVSQIKTGTLWPDQRTDLGRLYLSPVTSFASLYLVWALPFMEEFAYDTWSLVLARFCLACVFVLLAVVWRRTPRRLPFVVGLYLLGALGLAAAGL